MSTVRAAAAGGRSQLPAVVSVLIVGAIALWFTDVVAEIPTAALAGLVANATMSVIDVASFRTFARVRRSELLIALGCMIGVLVLGPIGGLMLATVATMIDMVRRIAGSPWVTLEPPGGDWEMERFAALADPDAVPSDVVGAIFVRLTGPLFFANAETLRDRVAEAAADDVRWVLLDFESVTDVDPTASEALADAVSAVCGLGKVIGIARAAAPVRRLLDLYGITEIIGTDHIYPSNREALAAFLTDREARP